MPDQDVGDIEMDLNTIAKLGSMSFTLTETNAGETGPLCIVTVKTLLVNPRFAKAHNLCIGDVVLSDPFCGQIREEDMRATEKDQMEMYRSLRPGDIVLARVISQGDAKTTVMSRRRTNNEIDLQPRLQDPPSMTLGYSDGQYQLDDHQTYADEGRRTEAHAQLRSPTVTQVPDNKTNRTSLMDADMVHIDHDHNANSDSVEEEKKDVKELESLFEGSSGFLYRKHPAKQFEEAEKPMDEGEGSSEKEGEDEDPSNLQLTWEILELTKVVHTKSIETSKDEEPLEDDKNLEMIAVPDDMLVITQHWLTLLHSISLGGCLHSNPDMPVIQFESFEEPVEQPTVSQPVKDMETADYKAAAAVAGLANDKAASAVLGLATEMSPDSEEDWHQGLQTIHQDKQGGKESKQEDESIEKAALPLVLTSPNSASGSGLPSGHVESPRASPGHLRRIRLTTLRKLI